MRGHRIGEQHRQERHAGEEREGYSLVLQGARDSRQQNGENWPDEERCRDNSARLPSDHGHEGQHERSSRPGRMRLRGGQHRPERTTEQGEGDAGPGRHDVER